MPLTREEKAWAESQLPAFIQHQKSKTLSSFWPSLWTAFLSQFPLTGLSANASLLTPTVVKDSKFQVSFNVWLGCAHHTYIYPKSIKNFLNNRNTCTRKTATPSMPICEPSGLAGTWRRSGCSHTKREIYSRTHYNTECKQKVNSEISGCGPGVTKGEHMSIHNKHIDLGWEAACMDPEKMAAIDAALKAEKAGKQESL